MRLVGRPGNEASGKGLGMRLVGKAWEWGWHIPTKLPHCLLCVDIIINHIINNHITRMSGTMCEHTDTTLANALGFIETHENIKHARTCFGHALILLWESTWTFTIAIQEHAHSFVNKQKHDGNLGFIYSQTDTNFTNEYLVYKTGKIDACR